jgi:hypothetical protein
MATFKITEEHLLQLGFNRRDVSIEESGDDDAYYYFTYDIGTFSLITSEGGSKSMSVEIFDYDEFKIRDYETLVELINILNKIKK